jgi:DNA-binding CsgD family transcriptional regulator
MLTALVFLIFILSVAMAAGGIVIATKLRSSFSHSIFSTLLYYQVFIYTFGFYGIWGQVAIKAFLSAYLQPELLGRLLDIAMLLGLPFLVFAWLMLLQFSTDISVRPRSAMFNVIFLLVNFTLLLLIGFFITRDGVTRPASLIKYFYITFSIVYTLVSALLILLPGKRTSVVHEHDRKFIAWALIFVMLIQCVPLLFYTAQVYLALIFIFTFFAGNVFLPVYFNYGTLLSAFNDEQAKDTTFEEFCSKFEVSPRETDIVREICNGLSNKEISDKLFISLQTVKDHTHRIYIKTNVRNRVQLINVVKELKKQ